MQLKLNRRRQTLNNLGFSSIKTVTIASIVFSRSQTRAY